MNEDHCQQTDHKKSQNNRRQWCGVPYCLYKSAYQLHTFPKSPELRKKWADACGIPVDKIHGRLGICCNHFVEDDFINISDPKKRKLRSIAIPSKNFPKKPSVNKSIGKLDPIKRSNISTERNEHIKNKSLSEIETASCKNESLTSEIIIIEDELILDPESDKLCEVKNSNFSITLEQIKNIEKSINKNNVNNNINDEMEIMIIEANNDDLTEEKDHIMKKQKLSAYEEINNEMLFENSSVNHVNASVNIVRDIDQDINTNLNNTCIKYVEENLENMNNEKNCQNMNENFDSNSTCNCKNKLLSTSDASERSHESYETKAAKILVEFNQLVSEMVLKNEINFQAKDRILKRGEDFYFSARKSHKVTFLTLFKKK